MKKLMILFLAVSTLLSCSQVGNGFKFQVNRNKVSWMNGTIGFRTDMNSNGKISYVLRQVETPNGKVDIYGTC